MVSKKYVYRIYITGCCEQTMLKLESEKRNFKFLLKDFFSRRTQSFKHH